MGKGDPEGGRPPIVLTDEQAIQVEALGAWLNQDQIADWLGITRVTFAAILERHYEEHKGKGFYAELVAFMSRGPVAALVVEGPEDTWEIVRAMMGATNPRTAAPGTIRGDYGTLFTENLVHGSDSADSAARELGIFFPAL